MSRLAPHALILLSALTAVGCIELDKDDGGDGDGGGALVDPTLHECTPVVPETLSGVIQTEMDHAGKIVTEFVAPPDRQSGLLTFSLVSPRSDEDLVTMGLTLYHWQLSTFQLELSVQPNEGVALAGVPAPGETVEMTLEEWGRGIPGPEGLYTAEAAWTWTEYDDCYEPNNTAAEARHVPTGVDHSAWMVSPLGETEEPVDYYRFTIAEDSVVTMSMDFPETIPMWIEIYPGDRVDVNKIYYTWFTDEPGSFLWESDGPLAAGTYTVRLAPFIGLWPYDFPLRPDAPHLYEPYNFRIDATPAG